MTAMRVLVAKEEKQEGEYEPSECQSQRSLGSTRVPSFPTQVGRHDRGHELDIRSTHTGGKSVGGVKDPTRDLSVYCVLPNLLPDLRGLDKLLVPEVHCLSVLTRSGWAGGGTNIPGGRE